MTRRKDESSQSITVVDIAKKAGVSITTVSRVTNNSNLVGKKTRNKVQKVIAEMNYIPNQMARGLSARRSKTIALIIPDISNPFFPELIHGVEDVVNKQGYSMFLCNSNFNHEKEKSYINEMAERRVDGVIIISAFLQDKSLIKRLNETTMRIVTIQSQIEGIDCIKTTDYNGMTEAIEHLIGLGHRKIAFICIDLCGCKNRYSAYTDVLTRNGISVNEEYVVENCKESSSKQNAGYLMTKRLLELTNPPTAIQTLNDYLAFGAYMAVVEKGLRIPEDISIVGYDDVTMARQVNPALTTVSQPAYAMGEAGGELLIKNISDGLNLICKEIVLPTKLIIRGSTGRVFE
jgi:LacI family transcriptional regulator